MVIIADTISCDSTPPACPECKSKSEVLAALAYTLALIQNAGTVSVSTELTAAKCYRCDSDKQLLDIMLGAFVAYAVNQGYATSMLTVLQNSKCFACAEPKLVKGVIVNNLCQFINDALPALL